jgi:hypothetical protein
MGRSRTTKPRPERQSIRFPQIENVTQAFGQDAAGMGEISLSTMMREFLLNSEALPSIQ